MCSWNAQVDRLPLELLGLPLGRDISHQPVTHLRVSDVQSSGIGVECGLCPVDPDSKAQPLLMGFICDETQPMGKFLWVRIPVPHTLEPAGIDVKHFYAQFLRLTNHAHCKRLI